MALKNFSFTLYILLFVLFALGRAIDSQQNLQQNMKNEMCLLKKQFPSQSWKTWYTLAGALQSMLCDSPTRPTIILLVSPPGGKHTARALAICLSRSIKKLMELDCECGSGCIIGADYASMNTGADFFEDIRSAMRAEGAAVVEDVQDVNFNGALMFLSMTGQSTTKFKDTALIMTVTSQGYGGGCASSPKVLAREYLTKTWGQTLQSDVLSSILDRITEYAIVVVPEDQPRRKKKKESIRCLGCESQNPEVEDDEDDIKPKSKSCEKREKQSDCTIV